MITPQHLVALPVGTYWQGHGVARVLRLTIGVILSGYFCGLKRAAIFQIRALGFRFLFHRMSLSQNRCTLFRDMLIRRDLA